MKELDLNNKVAVVTGGTAGIGLAIARLFFEHNCDVVVIGRDSKKGERAVEEILAGSFNGNVAQAEFESVAGSVDNKTSNSGIENLSGNKGEFGVGKISKIPSIKNSLTFIKCDVGLRKDVKSACEKILNDFKKVDILVLNAGMEFTEAITEVDPEHWQRMLDVNISGAFYFLKYLADSMIAKKTGNIIILSSAAATTGAGGGIHYPVTKAALKGLMSRINYELLPKGIRANIISPGMVNTPMLRKKYPDNVEVNAKLCEQVPMGRIGTPVDIANLALFLASDLSSYICGQDILIDGGRLYYRRPSITPQKP
jgi:3-oxoacyl-[acyl-carrier protein] reductase